MSGVGVCVVGGAGFANDVAARSSVSSRNAAGGAGMTAAGRIEVDATIDSGEGAAMRFGAGGTGAVAATIIAAEAPESKTASVTFALSRLVALWSWPA